MATITKFRRGDREPKKQRTDVVGLYLVGYEGETANLLQIDTFGSEERMSPGKQSQTIQLTPDTAFELYKIIGREFGFDK